MKLATFTYDGRSRIGAVLNRDVIDLQRAYARYLRDVEGDGAAERVAAVTIPDDMVAFLERRVVSWQAAERALSYAQDLSLHDRRWQARVRYDINEVRFERPLVPQTIMAAGPRPAPSRAEGEPIAGPPLEAFREFYIKPPTAVVGPHDPVRTRPNITERLTPEAELGLVFVGGGRHLTPEEALENVFGFTIFLDLIAPERLVFGWEGDTMFHARYGEGASFDTSGVLGPWIVTRDEVPALDQASVALYVNDRLQARYRLGDLWWPVAEYASYLSTFFPLEPSILGATGVPYGETFGPDASGNPIIASADEIKPVAAGDRIRVHVGGVGQLETVVLEPVAEGGAR